MGVSYTAELSGRLAAGYVRRSCKVSLHCTATCVKPTNVHSLVFILVLFVFAVMLWFMLFRIESLKSTRFSLIAF